MKKSVLLILFSVFFLFALPQQSNASVLQTKIILDGEEIVLPPDVQVTNMNNSVMIPLRIVAENLNFKVNWDQKSKTVKIQQNSNILSLVVGNEEATVGEDKVLLNVAPQMVKNTVMVPLRFVSEGMGLTVNWNNQDKIVTLTSNKQPDTEPTPPTGGNGDTTGLKRVSEISFVNNQLVVSMDGEVTPVISTLNNPNRIVVDLPNTTFSDTSQSIGTGTMGTLDVSDLPNISQIRYSLFSRDPAQVRIVIELSSTDAIQYSRQFIGSTLVVDLNGTSDPSSPPPVIPVVPPVVPVDNGSGNSGGSGRKVVVIDPGHGGSDPGTLSFSNKHEKEFTLALGLKVQALLLQEPEIEVVMTRETDVYPTRPERVKLANQLDADVFVSIHGNSVLASPTASGTETYYYQRNSSKELATVIHKHLIEALGFKDRGVKSNNYEVIRDTTMPAVLLEIGFLSNLAEEKALFSDSVQNKAAQAIVDGIKEYLGK